jgi:hypothetical protein
MASERLARILAQLSAGGVTDPGVARLCEVCASVTMTSGAAIMLVPADAPPVSLYTTNDESRLVEEAQFTLGEGPSVDAYHLERPVIEPDLANRELYAGRHSRPLCFEPECGPCSASHFGSAQSVWARWVFTVTWRDRSRTTSTRTHSS